ncbi:MAG: outer membrane beta-barrel protein [Chitinophagaceae bacterium]|nr:outer membrane beta-barrel protein [Chitinophagaceae bacterium]MBN8666571.1 outer membrane beta-barrel protein [Chitinophagales bacterium]
MILRTLVWTVLLSSPFVSTAQTQGITQEGEFGIGLGAAHYFGDLNTRAQLNRPKMAATLFFRKSFGNYISARVGASFAQLGYSDVYNTHNDAMVRRNLSFNSNVWELALQGDFNFFRFIPGEPGYSFTPYVTLGAGIFSYDPYAFLDGEKYFLRPLNTEGQGTSLYPDRKPYSTMAISVPFGVGVKYALNDRINIGFEILHRFTNTDYLDDVSKTYPGAAAFAGGTSSPGFLLSDRSYELGTPIGIEGRQRGNSEQKDQFVTAMFHVTFNLQSYRCPTAN